MPHTLQFQKEHESSRVLGYYLFPPIGAIVLLAVLSLFSLQEIRQSQNASEKSRSARAKLNEILRDLLNAETAQRGYLLTEDTSYLEPYYSAKPAIGVRFETFLRDVPDANIKNLVDKSRTSALAKLEELESVVDLVRDGRQDEALQRLQSGKGKELMDGFRASVSLAEHLLDQEIADRDNESWRAYFSAVGLATVAILLALAAIIWSLLRVDRELQRRRASDAIVRQRAMQLQSFADIAAHISSGRDIRSIVGIALNEFRQLIGCREALIQLATGDGKQIERGVIASGIQEPSHDYLACIFELVERIGGGHATYFRRRIDILKLEEVTASRAWKICGDAMDSILSAPIVNNMRVEIGRFVLMGKFGDEFNENDASIVSQLAFTLSVAIENARLNEQAHRSTEKKDEFLAMLGHELRNPLAGVLTGCEALMEDSTQSWAEESKMLIEAIYRQARITQHIINDLLDISRIGKGKIALSQSICDLEKLVKNAIQDYRNIYPEREIVLEYPDIQSMIFVYADQVRITQCITNLLHNACKFSPDSSEIVVRVACEPKQAKVHDTISIAVIDRGIGLDDVELQSIFELFYQSNKSIDRSQGGLGIGLALTKALIELHRGHLTVSSLGRGKGATFTISLPITEPPLSQTETQHRLPASQSTAIQVQPEIKAEVNENELATSIRILAIDDRADALLPIRVLMVRDGHQVIEANDGHEGYAKAKRFRPDLILCDIGLPGNMTGYDVAKAVRSDTEIQNIYMVALSGYSQPVDLEKSRVAGFDYHVPKPIDLATLRKIVKNRPTF